MKSPERSFLRSTSWQQTYTRSVSNTSDVGSNPDLSETVTSDDEQERLIPSCRRSLSYSQASYTGNQSATHSTVVDGSKLSKSSFKQWTRLQWITLIIQNSLIFTASIAYSLLSAFFSQEAALKGCDSFTTGLIFGVYELVVFITSPVFGGLVSRLTPRFMCLAGSFIASGCSILFGTLQWCPSGLIFIVMCFVVRIVNAVGSSMANVSSYSILSTAFPDHVAIVNSVAEMVSGLGFMLGPVAGAFLYDTGGFLLPFAVIGGVSLLMTFVAFFVIPSEYSTEDEEKSLNFYTLLKDPGITLIYIHMFGASLALTYLDPIMSQWLQTNFSISVTIVGLVFFIWSAAYTLLSPAIGKLTDKGYVFSLIFIGSILQCISLLIMGPSPLLPDIIQQYKQLWVVCLSCVLAGVACAAMFIPPYIAALNLVSVRGYTLDTNIFGMISGLIASSSSLGAFAGPSIAGYFNSKWGFEWSTTVCAFIVLSATTPTALYCLAMKCRGRKLAPDHHDSVTEVPAEENEEYYQATG